MLDTRAARQEHGKTVYADKGYQSQTNRQTLKQHGLRDGILRKDDSNRYDQSSIRRRNQLLSKVRARVEHIFGAWSQRGGKAVRCIGLLRAKAQITVVASVHVLEFSEHPCFRQVNYIKVKHKFFNMRTQLNFTQLSNSHNIVTISS